MAENTSVNELFEKLSSRFKPEKAQNDKALLAFELSGDNAGTYWMRVTNGTLETGQGEPPGQADLILRASADDFIRIMNGQLNPMAAFMSGKVKAERNMSIAMKLMAWFGL